MTDAGPAGGFAACKIGRRRRRIGQLGQRHESMSLEAEHKLVSQDAGSAEQRSAVETLGDGQDGILGLASSASGRVPSIVFRERSRRRRLEHVKSRGEIFEKA